MTLGAKGCGVGAATAIALLLGPLPGSGAAVPQQQTCDTSQYALSSPTSRFQDHGDGTVTDTQSNLMWLRCTVGQEWSAGTCVGEATLLTWKAAQESARALNSRGTHFFNDWRVPQIPELATIAERQCQNPRINLAVFPKTLAAAYWSQSSRQTTGEATSAFVLSFGPEGVSYETKEAKHYVRMVRNAP